MNQEILQSGLCFRLRKSAAALRLENGRFLYWHLFPGSLVQLANYADEQRRFITVLYEGYQLVMFVEDVLQGDLLDSETSKPDDKVGLGLVQ